MPSPYPLLSLNCIYHHLQILVLVGRVVDGVGVEGFEHAIDSITDGLRGIECVYIHQIEIFEYLIENLKILGNLKVMVLLIGYRWSKP